MTSHRAPPRRDALQGRVGAMHHGRRLGPPDISPAAVIACDTENNERTAHFSDRGPRSATSRTAAATAGATPASNTLGTMYVALSSDGDTLSAIAPAAAISI